MVFSFGYSLFIWVCSFQSGMVFSFGCGLFIWVWSFHSGMAFSFGYALFIWVWYSHIWVWSFHSGMVFSFGCGLFIRVWSFRLGVVFSFGYIIHPHSDYHCSQHYSLMWVAKGRSAPYLTRRSHQHRRMHIMMVGMTGNHNHYYV